MTSERMGEMFKGDSKDMCGGKFLLALMGGRADTSSVRRRGARTPIGASGNFTSKIDLRPICHNLDPPNSTLGGIIIYYFNKAFVRTPKLRQILSSLESYWKFA
jgi:hypothetical protein